jgi:hypothetical protein
MNAIEIYQKLNEKLPDAAVQRTKASDTKRGYDTTGYGYQWLINRLNETVGFDGWECHYTILDSRSGQYNNGKPYHEITVETEISIMGATKRLVGGHVAVLFSDALKGAITNSMKKTLALFGLGADSYMGTIDDDNEPLPEKHENMQIDPMTIENACAKLRSAKSDPERIQIKMNMIRNGDISHFNSDEKSILNRVDEEIRIKFVGK